MNAPKDLRRMPYNIIHIFFLLYNCKLPNGKHSGFTFGDVWQQRKKYSTILISIIYFNFNIALISGLGLRFVLTRIIHWTGRAQRCCSTNLGKLSPRVQTRVLFQVCIVSHHVISSLHISNPKVVAYSAW